MLRVLLFSFIAGVVGTMLGAIITVIVKRTSDRAIGIANCFAGGFMISITFVDLIPSALEVSNIWILLLGVFIGITLIFLANIVLDKALRKVERMKRNLDTVMDNRSSGLKSGIIILIAISLHNLPEGMAIGSQEVVAENAALAMTILIAIHNIPEGVAVAAPFVKSGMKWYKVLTLVFFTGLPTVIGAVLGHYIGDLNQYITGLCLALASGAMLYVVFEEMLYESYKHVKKRDVAIFLILGVFLGIAIISIL